MADTLSVGEIAVHESPSTLPPPPVAPRAVRSLPLEDEQNPTESSVDQSAPPCAGDIGDSPGSPSVHCSQYRLMQHTEENAEHAKVVDWLVATSELTVKRCLGILASRMTRSSTRQTTPQSSQSSSSCHRRKQSSPPAKLFKDGRLLVHLNYAGRTPLCYYATGLEEGGSHDYYECFDKRDILWARRVRFHINRMRYI